VTELVYGALWILLPWPAAIGYRRFLHGVLIRSGRTRLVALGTLLRLVGMTMTALLLFTLTAVPGAWVGAAALAAGVCMEALATRIMARTAVREVLATNVIATPAMEQPVAETDAESWYLPRLQARWSALRFRGYGEIARFYYPLALTSFIGLTVQPLLTFFMGRSPAPIESLAVFPVVHSLSFIFRALGLSYQEVVIALVGKRYEHVRILLQFGVGLALAASGTLALIAFTPLAGFWFETVSGLTPELAGLAIDPIRVVSLMPVLAVLLAFQHGLLVRGRRTRPITLATALEVATIAAVFAMLGWGMGVVGVTAAMAALVTGRFVANLFLLGRSIGTVDAG
jgi:progressive ankylosis protein